ncbi:MAG: NUDIX hydrolase [Gammaproteobacteria bacterium]|nr:MAG: NUDIX hydrolase [Gammaproteobacteria bacterium]
MLSTDLTVAAVVERDGRFLIVEERASGSVVITQPGGHIEAGESPEQAVVRETLEEAGCTITVNGLLGVYLWIHPQTRQQFLRIVYTADCIAEDSNRPLDHVISAVHWYSFGDLKHRGREVRSPIVLRAVEDYLAGRRQPDSLLGRLTPIQKNVDTMLANARLV